MIEVERILPVPPERVFGVLADGWSYPLWVVGATHMREVDDGWPSVGTRLHHSVGTWPLQIQDTTEVLAMTRDELLELRARAWPSGAARVRLTLNPAAGGTRVVMEEQAERGPATLIPENLQRIPLLWRNTESLARLESVVRNRG